VRLLGQPTSIASGDAFVWAPARRGTGAVVHKVDPETRLSVGFVEVGDDAGAAAVAGGSVWVANPSAGTVTRVRTTDLEQLGIVRIESTPTALAPGVRGLWVATR
jgi:hypothetical protein